MAEGNQIQTHAPLNEQQSGAVADIAAEFDAMTGNDRDRSDGRSTRGESRNYRGGEPMGSQFKDESVRTRDGKGRFTKNDPPDDDADEFEFEYNDPNDDGGGQTYDPDGELGDVDYDDDDDMAVPRQRRRDFGREEGLEDDDDQDDDAEFSETENLESLLEWSEKEFPGLPWQEAKRLGSREKIQDFMAAYEMGQQHARASANQYPAAEGQQRDSNLPNEQPPPVGEFDEEKVETPISNKLLEEGYAEDDLAPVREMEKANAKAKHEADELRKIAKTEADLRFFGETSDLEDAMDRVKPLRQLLGHQEHGISKKQLAAREAVFNEALAMQTNALTARGEYKTLAHYVRAAIAKAHPGHVKKAKSDQRTRRAKNQSRQRMGHSDMGVERATDPKGDQEERPEYMHKRFERFAKKYKMAFNGKRYN